MAVAESQLVAKSIVDLYSLQMEMLVSLRAIEPLWQLNKLLESAEPIGEIDTGPMNFWHSTALSA